MKIKAVFFGFGARSQCYANYLFLNENNYCQKTFFEKIFCCFNTIN